MEKSIHDFEAYRGNTQWYKNLERGIMSWRPFKQPSSLDDLMAIDNYNFELKTLNIIINLKLSDFPKDMPIYLFWSPYFDDPTTKNQVKIKIQKKQSMLMRKNIIISWLDAPHQMERVIPVFLSNFILNKEH